MLGSKALGSTALPHLGFLLRCSSKGALLCIEICAPGLTFTTSQSAQGTLFSPVILENLLLVLCFILHFGQ